jgi:SAM-dependent methyltransferase
LDFGAGFAGDARCLASEYADARVTCVEVQRHIHDAAQTFTRLLGLGNVCVHECVDVFDGASGDTNRGDADANVATFARVPGAPFDFLYSVLVVLHVPQREALWRALHANLKPGALVYVEDYFAAQPLTARDREQLAGPVACPYLPSAEEYKETLERAGFADVEWEVTTHAWTPFIETRLAAFRANETRNLRVHGPGLTKELDLFYATVHELFTRGNVGGVRIRARKKA